MLLDSTFLHDLVRGEPAAVKRLDELVEDRTSVAVSALTVFEVGVGFRGDSWRYLEQYQVALDGLSVLPLGLPEARNAVRAQYELLDRGERIGAVDVLLAGTARSHEMSVLTRNVDEFERVEGLAVETY